MATPLAVFLGASGSTVLVEIEATKGSSPRESGTFMLVAQNALWETIGGGQFEYIAIDHARAMLAGKTTEAVLDIPLGPEIGQCCGGRTLLRFTPVTSGVEQAIKQRLHDQQKCQPAVFIFGAGHVGKALAAALSLLPLTVTVIETRRGELEGLPDDIKTHVTPMPEALVKTIPSHGVVIIVTHDHALDFLIAREALARSDLSYVGMIGSKTKRATFTHWMQREGEERHRLDRLILPIGGAAVRDKRPTVIAAMVTAEILTTLSRVEAPELEPAIDQNPISGA